MIHVLFQHIWALKTFWWSMERENHSHHHSSHWHTRDLDKLWPLGESGVCVHTRTIPRDKISPCQSGSTQPSWDSRVHLHTSVLVVPESKWMVSWIIRGRQHYSLCPHILNCMIVVLFSKYCDNESMDCLTQDNLSFKVRRFIICETSHCEVLQRAAQVDYKQSLLKNGQNLQNIIKENLKDCPQ